MKKQKQGFLGADLWGMSVFGCLGSHYSEDWDMAIWDVMLYSLVGIYQSTWHNITKELLWEPIIP
jgi:hypothetical protein